MVRKASTPEELEKKLAVWHPNADSWEQLGDSIFIPAVMSDLAGQLMVRGHESNVIQMAADGGNSAPFLNKPWEEALAEFKARGVMKPTELSKLLGDYAQRTDKARQLMLQQIQGFVRTELERSIREGGTMRDFAKRIEDGDAGLGITADDPSYLNMVFRTNVQSAYGAGRFRAMTDPDVMEARPYAEYRTVGDARVRPEHAVLDKTVYAIASDEWKRIAPPNSYACRCSMVSLTREEAAGRDIRTDIPEGYKPTPGFDSPPIAKVQAATLPLPDKLKQQVQVPEQLVPEAKPSDRVGATAEGIFGRKLSDDELDALVGHDAQLPNGFKTEVTIDETAEKRGKTTRGKDLVLPANVTATGLVRDANGDAVGTFERVFERDGDKLTVTHANMRIHEEARNQGIGRALFNAQIDAYEKHGVDRVKLSAIDVGKYVWSKAGFEWEDAAQLERVLASLRAELTKRYGADSAGKLMAATKTPSDIARLVVDGERVGKDFLLNLGDDPNDSLIDMAQTPSKITRL